ncbi:MAG: inner membrane CreD family protein [Acidobacteria bacterium]|nr:inner membrane CreD family protein [Acidobacteriota bacterium]
MVRRLIAIALVYMLVCLAWFALAASVSFRTYHQEGGLKTQVAALWGDEQEQLSPELVFTWPEIVVDKEVVEADGGERKQVSRQREVWKEASVILDSSRVRVDLDLDQRRKGLLWYSTYGVEFAADHAYTHEDDRPGVLVIRYRFPTARANYDNFRFTVAGREDAKITPIAEQGTKLIEQRVPVAKGTTIPFSIAYRSRGLESWRYSFGSDVNRIKNFSLAMTTDFDEIDFPAGTISPTTKQKAGQGWALTWASDNLISGFQIGMTMPHNINPGPLAARMAAFAPVSLGFFFVWMFVITLIERVELHPMNYLFLAAAFFSFHLLFSYTVDHIPVAPAFAIASAASVLLVVSYLRLAVGLRFAAVEAGVSQFVYLVLFSFAHMFSGLTGLIVTIGSVLTLFALMQLTGRMQWRQVFERHSATATA